MKVFSDLKTRGCGAILIAVTDGLKGMSEALAAVFPATTVQTCIESVHAQLRKIIKIRGHFPNDEAATKLIWLALRNITANGSEAPFTGGLP